MRPIRFIVPTEAGSQPDAVCRLVASKLSERSGWQTVVEDRPGGNFVIAIQSLLRAPPDGHTIVQGTATFPIVPQMQKVDWDLFRDLIPVARITKAESVIVGNPSVPAKNIQELIAWSKANPGKLTFGGVGVGTFSQLTAELLRLKLGLDFLYIPYKAPPTLELLAGRVMVANIGVSEVTAYVASGKLVPYLVLGNRRSAFLPNIPTSSEISGGDPDMSAQSWFGYYVRSGTPQALVDQLAQELIGAISEKTARDRLNAIGAPPLEPMEGPAEFKKSQEAEYNLWRKIIKASHLSVE
jgi:tripartite-type tricarboxylate transporter receptor subunit TctC